MRSSAWAVMWASSAKLLTCWRTLVKSAFAVMSKGAGGSCVSGSGWSNSSMGSGVG